MANPHRTRPRTGRGQQRRREGRAASRSPSGRRTDLRYRAAGLAPHGLALCDSHLRVWEERMRCDRPAQPAIPHLARIRMNARPARPPNTGIARRRATKAGSSRRAAGRTRSGFAGEALGRRSPVTEAMDGECQANLPRTGQGPGKGRSPVNRPWMASPHQTCPRTGQGQQEKTRREPLEVPSAPVRAPSRTGRRASHLDGLALCVSTFASSRRG